MPEQNVSIDEFLYDRKDFVKSGDVLMKAATSPSSWNDAKRSARFTMSAEVEDRDGDIVMQDGIDVAAFMNSPVAPYAHGKLIAPLGTWANISKVNGRPKRTEGDCVFDPEGIDADADKIAAKVRIGTIRCCSIGFIPHTVRKREQSADSIWSGYEILECELVECSIVPIASNPLALAKEFLGAGAEDFVLARDLIERVLDEWAYHPETGLLVPRGEYEKAYKALKAKPPAQAEEHASADNRSQDFGRMTKPQAKSFLSRAISRMFGDDDAQDEPAPIDPAVAASLKQRAEALEARLAAKGLS